MSYTIIRKTELEPLQKAAWQYGQAARFRWWFSAWPWLDPIWARMFPKEGEYVRDDWQTRDAFEKAVKQHLSVDISVKVEPAILIDQAPGIGDYTPRRVTLTRLELAELMHFARTAKELEFLSTRLNEMFEEEKS